MKGRFIALATVLACFSIARAADDPRGLKVVYGEGRTALVIGNSAYKDAPLANPVNDERAIVQALKESGFTVIVRENADQRAMLSALREFGDHLRAGGTGLFYYAGHGMQIKGRNYLIPVGASIEREDEVAFSAVDAQAVLDKMEAAGNPANIMILDACRNNPFTRSTAIPYSLARQTHVNLAVFNVSGQRVRTLVDGTMPLGSHVAVWDGRDQLGRRASTGVYFYRLWTTSYDAVRKLTLLR